MNVMSLMEEQVSNEQNDVPSRYAHVRRQCPRNMHTYKRSGAICEFWNPSSGQWGNEVCKEVVLLPTVFNDLSPENNSCPYTGDPAVDFA